MSLPTCLEPENARITIPVVLAIGYALYHWWRWRMLHPKIVLEDLPEPASEAMPAVSEPKNIVPSDGERALRSRKRSAARSIEEAEHGGAQQGLRWKERLHFEKLRAQFDSESFDVYYHARAFHKATHGRPEYFVRLAEYAWRRGAMVETHHWLSTAKIKGVVGLEEWMEHVRLRWIQSGHHPEDGNVYEIFPVERMMLAHQYLMLVCGFSVQVNRLYLTKAAEKGNEEAKMFLDSLANTGSPRGRSRRVR